MRWGGGGGLLQAPPWHPQLTRKPAEEGVRLEQGPVAQRAGDDGFIALEVVHGAGVELAVCLGTGWG